MKTSFEITKCNCGAKRVNFRTERGHQGRANFMFHFRGSYTDVFSIPGKQCICESSNCKCFPWKCWLHLNYIIFSLYSKSTSRGSSKRMILSTALNCSTKVNAWNCKNMFVKKNRKEMDAVDLPTPLDKYIVHISFDKMLCLFVVPIKTASRSRRY